ncbi:uncharacterized protein LOC131957253 [Physella acuta]|uniref:uncharacterized protein LOC131957253 n=1 Tax=Physella acuta TaxID=109671 RepID=UPI0027DD2731|nr:uncharacterized protein LOC131957253 [Physella acuta]XP_059177974.1 uncharacterized protein LOC131957253 [Physella acuta]
MQDWIRLNKDEFQIKVKRCREDTCQTCRQVPHLSEDPDAATACQLESVVFILYCEKCNKMYIGQTIEQFRKYFSNIKSELRAKDDRKRKLISHFNGPDKKQRKVSDFFLTLSGNHLKKTYCTWEDLKCLFLNQEDNTDVRNNEKHRLITKFNTVNQGLNTVKNVDRSEKQVASSLQDSSTQCKLGDVMPSSITPAYSVAGETVHETENNGLGSTCEMSPPSSPRPCCSLTGETNVDDSGVVIDAGSMID